MMQVYCWGMTETNVKGDKRRPSHLFQPGNTVAKDTKSKRGKAKLKGAFVDDLTNEWNQRGKQALADLTGKDLVNACIAILPKDVLVQMESSTKVRWVISADPIDTAIEWKEKHGLPSQVIDSTSELVEK